MSSSLMDTFDRFGAAQMPVVATEPAAASPAWLEFARALRNEPGCAACDLYWLSNNHDEWMVAPNRYADGPLDAQLQATVDALRLRLGVPSAVVIMLVFRQ